MNILIATEYNTFVTIAPEHAAALTALLPHLRIVTTSGYGDSLIYQTTELPPNVSFVDSDKLAPLSESERALKRALEDKNTELVLAYNGREEQKKRVAELERQLSELKAAA